MRGVKWSRSVVSDSWRPCGLLPTRLLRPWDFPSKSTISHRSTKGMEGRDGAGGLGQDSPSWRHANPQAPVSASSLANSRGGSGEQHFSAAPLACRTVHVKCLDAPTFLSSPLTRSQEQPWSLVLAPVWGEEGGQGSETFAKASPSTISEAASSPGKCLFLSWGLILEHSQVVLSIFSRELLALLPSWFSGLE